ncbi:hypothetical protein [Nostoc sp. FACHB-145]|uniref:hypothetical protein n=1 Tax=Nostoc sp. FACHB-145 TaxID=2692836 RepID=UPI001686F609|nr:hypothetical protein [Nostoc sp. FACHB-145]MBD2471499.1 hypothetical protein [Nostoc sp. FACHB-145]
MIIPFDLQTQAIATDGRKCIFSTVYVDIIEILTSAEEALTDPEMQGTIDMIAEGGSFSGDGVDEFLLDALKELQAWEFVQEVNNGDYTYWVLSPKGLLLKAEIK